MLAPRYSLPPQRNNSPTRGPHGTRKQVGEHVTRRLLARAPPYAFLADRQVFMNALRSAPFLPVACFAHSRILSCCETFTGAASVVAVCALTVGALLATGGSARATALDIPSTLASTSIVRTFIAISSISELPCGRTGLSATTPSLTPEETARRSDVWMMQKLEPRSNGGRKRPARA